MTGQNKKNNTIRPIRKTVVQPERVTIQRVNSDKDIKSSGAVESVSKQVAALKKIPKEIVREKPEQENVPELQKSLQKALAEHQKMSATLDSAKKESERLQATIDRLNQEIKNGKSLEASNEKSLVIAEKEIHELQSEIIILNNQISAIKNQQVQVEDSILKPDQVSSMMDDIRNNLSGDLPGLLVKEIELRLNVQIKQRGENDVILIPVTRETAINKTNGEFVLRMMPLRR